jgi:hypothetical protein
MKTLLLISVLLLAAPVHAQTQPPSDASIRELLALSKSERLLDGMWQQMDEVMKSSVTAATSQGLNDAQRKVMDDMSTQMVQIFRDVMSWKDLEPTFIGLYKETLTQSDVDGMVTFYKSDAGQALIEKMPLIMQRSMTLMTDKVQILSPRLKALQQETSRKLQEAADE